MILLLLHLGVRLKVVERKGLDIVRLSLLTIEVKECLQS